MSVQGSLCPWVSVLGGLCPGRGLCPGVVSVQGGLCPGGLCLEGICPGVFTPGDLSGRPLPTATPSDTCGRYASYWNAFFSARFFAKKSMKIKEFG